MIRFSLLDQSVRFADVSAADALAGTMEAARLADRLGYHRLWVSEHHASRFLCGSAPEILIAAIGAHTRHIRLGSGGVMLPHYSAYKVAEQFAVLSNLYPGRIDLGVGRAPGGEMRVAAALSAPHPPSFREFPQQVAELVGYMEGSLTDPRLSPEPSGDVPVWILGTSPDSAMLAGALGLPYALALFINPQADPGLTDLYRRHFVPSAQLAEPYVMLATTAFACDDPERAELLRKNYFLNIARLLGGSAQPAISPEASRDIGFTEREAMIIGAQARIAAFGTPDAVREKVLALAQAFGADEVMISCNAYHQHDRLRAIELFANSMTMAEAA
ncbi:luciferase family oxidoreductase group 1 [Blastomonas natatoria]|uniref:Luciferase family oxidoreductase group 1 n=1 Tax=Blastomonas natatoria TaxID=34015 RepID=A0A2V3VHH6_9SPHN|nr:LLM class flavin-dependent oxidoreductase [Blastomonas natatoria]PXW76069.1 luciferase family oxidoreductase group 1 [Blastomonas natatoria]